MVKYCAAKGCINSWNQNKNVTFHRFPHKRPEILEKWIKASKIKSFDANLCAMLCGDHFTPDCYMESNHRKLLKKDAIPTLFNSRDTSKNSENFETDNNDSSQPTSSSNDTNHQSENGDEKSPSEQSENQELPESTNMACCDVSKNQMENGWFKEINEMWPGQYFALKIEKTLYCKKSNFQNIKIVQTTNHGKALILDGIIQCTENDEFAYQEMISFLPLCAHPNPETVLIIGGGDGGVAREVTKHPLVKRIVQVEIDEKVINACKEYLPSMAKGFESPKLDLQICDGFEYMKNHKNEFDVIITDSSDPIGPASALFSEKYFEFLKNALKPGGVICSQGGTVWSGIEQVRNTLVHCRKHFKEVRYAIANVPTYPTGQIGFIIGTLDENLNLTKAKFEIDSKEFDLKYYNSNIHSASFVLPNFVEEILFG